MIEGITFQELLQLGGSIAKAVGIGIIVIYGILRAAGHKI
jgi:hypothetical protein